MALRTFHDSAGVEWQVWDVRPPQLAVPYLPEGVQEGGWLAFRAGDQMRRLRPIPDDWETISPQDLERLCALATPAKARA